MRLWFDQKEETNRLTKRLNISHLTSLHRGNTLRQTKPNRQYIFIHIDLWSKVLNLISCISKLQRVMRLVFHGYVGTIILTKRLNISHLASLHRGNVLRQNEVNWQYIFIYIGWWSKVLTLMSRISKVRRAIWLLFNQCIAANRAIKMLYRYPFSSLHRRDKCWQIYVNWIYAER